MCHSGIVIIFFDVILCVALRGGKINLNIAEEIDGKIVKKVLDALTKKATGYETKETTEEYSNDGSKEVLVKRKVLKHYVPADISAIKLLLDICNTKTTQNFFGMSDDELDKEVVRLFKEYQNLTSADIYKQLKGEIGEDCKDNLQN